MLRIDDIPQQVADDIHALRRDLLRNLLNSPTILWYNENRKAASPPLTRQNQQIRESFSRFSISQNVADVL